MWQMDNLEHLSFIIHLVSFYLTFILCQTLLQALRTDIDPIVIKFTI